MTHSMPIVILTKDKLRFLDLMIKSILNRAEYPYQLFVLDNNCSDSHQKSIMNKFINNSTIGKIGRIQVRTATLFNEA